MGFAVLNFGRERAKQRVRALVGERISPRVDFSSFNDFEEAPRSIKLEKELVEGGFGGVLKHLGSLLFFAELSLRPVSFLGVAIGLGCLVLFLVGHLVSPWIYPLCFGLGFGVPFLYLESRITKRAQAFIEDYPTVLLATASSVKSGMTPQIALERSVKLLPAESPVRREVNLLLDKIRQGVPKDIAIASFAKNINQPELELFRSAYLLIEENGGKFAPTLERLALVSKDRSALVSQARVSSATMRLTANFLLVVTPIILFVVSFRSDDYWSVIIENSMANTMASIGLVLILGGYMVLQRMSSFKP